MITNEEMLVKRERRVFKKDVILQQKQVSMKIIMLTCFIFRYPFITVAFQQMLNRRVLSSGEFLRIALIQSRKTEAVRDRINFGLLLAHVTTTGNKGLVVGQLSLGKNRIN